MRVMQQIRKILSCEDVDREFFKSQKTTRYYNMLCLFDDPGASENPISFRITRHHNAAEVESITLNALIFRGPFTIKEAKNTLIQCFREEDTDMQFDILQFLFTRRTWRVCEDETHKDRIAYSYLYSELMQVHQAPDQGNFKEA
jgi:hypothetical protein